MRYACRNPKGGTLVVEAPSVSDARKAFERAVLPSLRLRNAAKYFVTLHTRRASS